MPSPHTGCSSSRPTTSTFFFFNDTATTEIYTLSLHDALPICGQWPEISGNHVLRPRCWRAGYDRSEEHTSELQSHSDLVCRLLLEKKNTASREAVLRCEQPRGGVLGHMLLRKGRRNATHPLLV